MFEFMTINELAESDEEREPLTYTVDDVNAFRRQSYDEGHKAGYEQALTHHSNHENHDSMSIMALAAELKRLKNRLDEIGALKTEIQKSYDYLSIEVLPDRMEEEGIETLKIKDVGRLQSSADIRCNIPAQNKEEVKTWLREHGHGSMIGETINASTLKAFVREMIKEGKEWPQDLLNVHPYTRATVVKS